MVLNERKTVEYKELENLRFDPQNPRLPSRIDKSNDIEVLDYMIRKENVGELMGAIGEVGFFAGEPLLIVGPPDAEEFIVVEGNRRLAAVKLLLRPEVAPARQKYIQAISDEATKKDALNLLPVLRFDHRDEIIEYLGYRHITGIQEWDTLAKARYLRQLMERQDSDSRPREVDRVLAKEIGSRADYVGRLLATLAVYEVIEEKDYYDIDGLDEETLSFSVLLTGLGYTNIAKFVGLEDPKDRELDDLSQESLSEIVYWMFGKNPDGEKILPESRDLDKLSAVVVNDEARDLLREKFSLEDAYLLTEGPAETFRQSLTSALADLNSAWSQYRRVHDLSQEDITLLTEVIKTASDLRKLIRDQLETLEDIL